MEKKLTNREIGMRLKLSRGAKNLTLQQVADIVGVDRSTIQRYEAGGIVVIKRPVIESICKCLKVNYKWVLGESETKAFIESDDIPEDVLLLARRLSDIPSEKRKKLMITLNSTVDLFEEN